MAASKTLRKLPRYGDVKMPPSFEWPTSEDLQAMNMDGMIKVSEILFWKKNGKFSAIQVCLANGANSSFFKASDFDLKDTLEKV